MPMCSQRSDDASNRPWQISGAKSGHAVRSGGDLPGPATNESVDVTDTGTPPKKPGLRFNRDKD